jgi:hypothetical protein
MKGKDLVKGLAMLVCLLMLSVPNVVAQGEQCKGDFDCDLDVDADDVTVFLQHFGRSQYNNPCPPYVYREPRTDYCTKIRKNRAGMINPYKTTDDDGLPNLWIESISHNIPSTVSVGELVNATIDFNLGDVEGCPVIYNDIYSDWDPDNRLAGISYTYCDPTSKSMPFSFTAPSVPGKYRIRWMHSSTYIPIHSFYCGYDGHWETPANPDYMASAGTWMEVPIEVIE